MQLSNVTYKYLLILFLFYFLPKIKQKKTQYNENK